MFCVFQDEKDGEEKGRKYLEKGNIFFRDVEECMSMTFYIPIGIEIAIGLPDVASRAQ